MAKWQPGQSGNPSGRKVGTLTKAGRLRQSLNDSLPEILNALTEQAKAGDVQAAKLIIDRTLPALRPIEAPVNERPVLLLAPGEPATLTSAADAVLRSLADGSLTPATAGEIIASLTGLARIKEVSELDSRLAALEELMRCRNTPTE